MNLDLPELVRPKRRKLHRQNGAAQHEMGSWISLFFKDMGVSENGGTPKSSILIGFSLINHPFWDSPILGNPHISLYTPRCTPHPIDSHGAHRFFPWSISVYKIFHTFKSTRLNRVQFERFEPWPAGKRPATSSIQPQGSSVASRHSLKHDIHRRPLTDVAQWKKPNRKHVGFRFHAYLECSKKSKDCCIYWSKFPQSLCHFEVFASLGMWGCEAFCRS